MAEEEVDVEQLFAEAKQRRTERDGLALTIGGHRFVLWPATFTYEERILMGQLTGSTPSDIALKMGLGTGRLELLAAFIAQAMFKSRGQKRPDMTGIIAWIEEQISEGGADIFDLEVLRVDDGRELDDDEQHVQVVAASEAEIDPKA